MQPVDLLLETAQKVAHMLHTFILHATAFCILTGIPNPWSSSAVSPTENQDSASYYVFHWFECSFVCQHSNIAALDIIDWRPCDQH